MNHEKTSGWMTWLTEKSKQGTLLRKDQLLIVILSGVLLLVIALPVGKTEKNTDGGKNFLNMGSDLNVEKDVKLVEDSGRGTTTSQRTSLGEENDCYAEEMEKKLEQILTSMDQVGRVKVILTLKASGEKVVEKDIPISRSNTQEEDAQGGNRSINSVDSQESTVYETDSGKSTPYVIQTTSPRVEGAVVVCEGAGIGSVSKNITEAIEVLFGIEPHKIKVVKMKTS